MIEPKGINIEKAFTVSGVKEIGSYIYVLLLDFAGLALIKRVKADNTEIKFYKIPDGELVARWLNPDEQTYIWIHQA